MKLHHCGEQKWDTGVGSNAQLLCSLGSNMHKSMGRQSRIKT